MNDRPAPVTPGAPASGGSPSWIAIAALAISTITLLFGNALVFRIQSVFSHWQWALPLGGNAGDGPACTLAALNILLATYVLFDVRPKRARRFTQLAGTTPEAQATVTQLVHGWRYLWATWIVMYSWLGLSWSGALGSAAWPRYISDVLNAFNGFWFYYLYFVLDAPSVSTPGHPDRAEGFHHAIETAAIIGLAVCIVSIVTAVVSSVSALSASAVQTGALATQVIPAYVAIGMAFFVGRLDSHYLRFPRIVLAPLYLYVVMQLSWGFVVTRGTDTSDRIVVLSLALILKTVVFVFVSSALSTGRFMRYVVDLNAARERDVA